MRAMEAQVLQRQCGTCGDVDMISTLYVRPGGKPYHLRSGVTMRGPLWRGFWCRTCGNLQFDKTGLEHKPRVAYPVRQPVVNSLKMLRGNGFRYPWEKMG
jgi:hypothetical protein